LWARRAGGILTSLGSPHQKDCGYGIAVDYIGNSYVTGSFADSADFGGIDLTGNLDQIFLAKYDPSGNVLWATSPYGGSDEEGRAITINSNGEILIGGSYVAYMFWGSTVLYGWGNYDAFIAKYDQNGNFMGVMNAGGPLWNEYVYGLCADNTGNVFAAGRYCGTSYFGPDSLVTPAGMSSFQMFVGKINLSAGIEDMVSEADQLIAYPNPCTEILHLKTDQKGIVTIQNILGQSVWSVQNQENSPVDISGLKSGVYFIRLETEKNTYSTRFVKQ